MLGKFKQPLQSSWANALITTFPSISFMTLQAKQSAEKTASWELPFVASLTNKELLAVWLLLADGSCLGTHCRYVVSAPCAPTSLPPLPHPPDKPALSTKKPLAFGKILSWFLILTLLFPVGLLPTPTPRIISEKFSPQKLLFLHLIWKVCFNSSFLCYFMLQ